MFDFDITHNNIIQSQYEDDCQIFSDLAKFSLQKKFIDPFLGQNNIIEFEAVVVWYHLKLHVHMY